LENRFDTDREFIWHLPISLGIPALTLGGEGKEFGNHSPNEWFDPPAPYLGPQRVFWTILGLIGVEGVSEPLLLREKGR